MDQPREKLRALGAGAPNDAELPAIFLWVGLKGKTAVALAEGLSPPFWQSATPTILHLRGINPDS